MHVSDLFHGNNENNYDNFCHAIELMDNYIVLYAWHMLTDEKVLFLCNTSNINTVKACLNDNEIVEDPAGEKSFSERFSLLLY